VRQLTVFAVLVLLSIVATPAFADSILLTENFDNVAALGAAGWVFTNNSSPIGSTGWFQGNPAVFPAQQGAPNSYIGANFENAALGGNISNWLLTPLLTLKNGDTISFFTQGAGIFADRLELRFSASGASTDVGATDASVGVFTNLLLTVNPALNPNGYPTAWTQFSVTVSGLGGATTGRFGFRYFVPDTNVNANYIGIDTVRVNAVTPVPEPAMLPILSLSLAALGLVRRVRARR
jgi:hypothetical protein